MSRKTDVSREARLWVGTIISMATAAVIIGTNPYVQWKARSAATNIKNYFNAKKKEKEEKKKHEPEIKVNYSKVVSQEEL